MTKDLARFQSIVNKMHAKKPQLSYDNHERAKNCCKPRSEVWEIKVVTIIGSLNYETLTVDELFSKLKSIEID